MSLTSTMAALQLETPPGTEEPGSNQDAEVCHTCGENPAKRSQRSANRYGIATRAQVLTLKVHTTLTNDQITAISGVQKSEIQNIMKRAKERGWTPEGRLPLQDAFFEDGKRTGAPKKNG